MSHPYYKDGDGFCQGKLDSFKLISKVDPQVGNDDSRVRIADGIWEALMTVRFTYGYTQQVVMAAIREIWGFRTRGKFWDITHQKFAEHLKIDISDKREEIALGRAINEAVARNILIKHHVNGSKGHFAINKYYDTWIYGVIKGSDLRDAGNISVSGYIGVTSSIGVGGLDTNK
jgi:hypothetical protein